MVFICRLSHQHEHFRALLECVKRQQRKENAKALDAAYGNGKDRKGGLE